MAFGPDSTADEVLDGLDLSGTVAVVTGASSGLGVETVRVLAARGATVVATSRDADKTAAALAGAGVHLDGSVIVEAIDLADLASIRSGTERIRSTVDELSLLIANAGVMACPQGRTSDGFETQFGTNHLGHFVLVNRLLPLLVAGAPSRIVCVSSTAHRGSDVDLTDPNFDAGPYEPFVAYGRSKTANVLFAVELDRRLRERGVRACAVHPGGVDTPLFRHLDEETLAMMAKYRKQSKSIASGASTTVWAALVADGDEIGGQYAENCSVADVSDAPGTLVGVQPYALDRDRAQALWALSEKMTGERFPEQVSSTNRQQM